MAGVVAVEKVAVPSAKLEASIERCRREIAEIESLLLAGHRDVQGLCMAPSDWSAELMLIERDCERFEHVP
jgi:hypothetical protein